MQLEPLTGCGLYFPINLIKHRLFLFKLSVYDISEIISSLRLSFIHRCVIVEEGEVIASGQNRPTETRNVSSFLV